MLEEPSGVSIATLTSQSRLSLDESDVDLNAPNVIRSEPVGLTARSPVQNGAVSQSTPLLAEQFLRSEFNQEDSMNLQVTFSFIKINFSKAILVAPKRAARNMVSKIRE